MNSYLRRARGIGGSGVYGLSASGRARFASFPDVIADDGFIRLQFESGERETIQDCHSTVFAPRTLRELIRIKTRSHLGTTQLRRRFPDRWQHRGESNSRTLLKLFANPLLWPNLAIYTYVKLAARYAAKRRLAVGNLAWDRDDSSRQCDGIGNMSSMNAGATGAPSALK
jgi:hypothetical protein